MNDNQQPTNILLIDGDCMLCNGFLQFVITNDHQKQFHFAALQSEKGQLLLKEYGLPVDALETVVFIQKNKAYVRSKAILKTIAQLKWWGKMLYFIGSLIPTSLADKIYKWVAKNRYLWFGKTDTCFLQTPELNTRILSETNSIT